MLRAVEQFLDGDPQGRHPVWVIAIKGVGKFDELPQRLFALYRNNLNACQ